MQVNLDYLQSSRTWSPCWSCTVKSYLRARKQTTCCSAPYLKIDPGASCIVCCRGRFLWILHLCKKWKSFPLPCFKASLGALFPANFRQWELRTLTQLPGLRVAAVAWLLCPPCFVELSCVAAAGAVLSSNPERWVAVRSASLLQQEQVGATCGRLTGGLRCVESWGRDELIRGSSRSSCRALGACPSQEQLLLELRLQSRPLPIPPAPGTGNGKAVRGEYQLPSAPSSAARCQARRRRTR